MRRLSILLSFVFVAGCMPSASGIKEREYERQRAVYLALKDSKDQQAIKAFDHFFDAERFRRDYWIHLASGRTNGFWWGSIQDSPEFGRYTVYMLPLNAFKPDDSGGIYRMRLRPPVTPESVTDALEKGYADLDGDKPVIELIRIPVVVASREGGAIEKTLFMTLVVDLHGEYFAIAVVMDAGSRAEVIDHLKELLGTARSANQGVRRSGARRAGFGAAESSSVGLAANIPPTAPVGIFRPWNPIACVLPE